jgi:arylsulfatase A-like enzyme
MNRRKFIGAAVAGMTLPQALSLPPRPNVLFILADDLGYGDLSCYGRPDYKTPVIDGLASEGIKFTDSYANGDVCTPTRVAFHTGRYQHRLPIGLQQPLGDGNSEIGLPADHPTISSLLKSNGYETALIGKWHVGNAPQFNPIKHGYDEFFGIVGSSQDYFTHRNTSGVMDLYENEKPVDVDGYLTDVFSEKAVRFVRRKRTRPFYLSLHYNAPHWPWQGPGDRESALKENGRAGANRPGSDEIYGEMMKSMDSGIGRVVDALRTSGLERNTLVIFTSDNGGERYARNWPFSFRKGSLWEGGIRVPAIVRWSGVVPPGKTTDQAAITLDWTATILKTTGTDSHPAYPLEGVDLMAVCTGQRSAFQRTLFWRNRQHQAMRSGNRKYLREQNGEHLFDLIKDPGEKADLKLQQAALFEDLKNAYQNWNSQMLPLPPVPAGRGGARGGRGQTPAGGRGQ